MTDKQPREAAAIAAALLVARLAGWRFERDRYAPVLPVTNCLHARAAHLLLVPSVAPVGSDNAVIAAAAERLGCDALVVRAAGRDPADISFDVVLAGEPGAWSTPLALWVDADGAAHLVLDAPDTTSVELLPTGLRGRKSPPWSSDAEREAGLRRGQAELARVLEGR